MAVRTRSEASSKSSSSGVRFQPDVDFNDDREPHVLHTASIGSASSASKKRVSHSLAGDFIRANTVDPDHAAHGPSFCQRLTKKLRKTNYVNNIMVFVVLLDAYCNAASIDARAAGNQTPQLWTVLSDVCLVLYSLELALQFYLDGTAILRRGLIMMDVIVISAGYVEGMLDLIAPGNEYANLGVLSILRLARVLRLLKLLRKVKSLRELQKLVKMMHTCIKALFWSFIFCFVVMTIWAMLIVEWIDPYVRDMVDAGLFEECGVFCETATTSVMKANLLLFKTVIAGDSWGQMAVPVILMHPETAVIFVGSSLTLVFGVLNLIVAVVVDTFADARERDILNLAEELEQDVAADRKFLQKIFDRIDEDGAGQLSLEQLVAGARQDAEFQSRLRIMDIDEMDLVELFQMIDTDGSGTIEAPEFIKPLSRWVHDSKTAPRFIKYNMLRTMHQQEELQKQCDSNFEDLHTKIDRLTLSMDRLMAGVSATAASKSFSSHWVEHTSVIDGGGWNLDIHDLVEQPHASKRVALKEGNASLEEALEATVVRLRGMVLEVTDQALQYASAGMGELLREGLDSHFGHVSPDSKRQGQGRRSLRALSTRTTFDSSYSGQDMANEPKPLDVPPVPVQKELTEATVPPALFTQDMVGLQLDPQQRIKA
ncbi:Scn11a [Symbiodinium sp. CCMP2456]|nr:Scn11a [Symbiodinium sp. CCMP2456]